MLLAVLCILVRFPNSPEGRVTCLAIKIFFFFFRFVHCCKLFTRTEMLPIWDPALLEHWCFDKKRGKILFRNKTSSPFESKK